MTTQQEAIFEAPAAHEASYYGNPEWEHPEAHTEWEHPEGHPYASTEWEQHPEGEWEWEQHEGQPEWEHPEAHPYASTEREQHPEGEWEWEQHEGQPEWEHPESHPYASTEREQHPEGEWEWEQHEGQPEWEHPEAHPYASTEWEHAYATEADPFFGSLKRLAKKAGGFAKSFALPLVTKALGTMIPGAGPLIGLASSLVREGETEASAMEAQLFGTSELHPEVGHNEVSHEAALTEVMAHEAMSAQTEGEAEAVLTGALPITITIMGARRSLRPVIPMLAQANGRLVRTLRRQGPAGRHLLRTVPAIQRRTIAGLRVAARRGQPITGPLAVQTMAAAARRVLGSPQQVQRALVRNRMLRQRLAPFYPSRNQVSRYGGFPPYHPRRAYGYPSMRPAQRRMPV